MFQLIVTCLLHGLGARWCRHGAGMEVGGEAKLGVQRRCDVEVFGLRWRCRGGAMLRCLGAEEWQVWGAEGVQRRCGVGVQRKDKD